MEVRFDVPPVNSRILVHIDAGSVVDSSGILYNRLNNGYNFIMNKSATVSGNSLVFDHTLNGYCTNIPVGINYTVLALFKANFQAENDILGGGTFGTANSFLLMNYANTLRVHSWDSLNALSVIDCQAGVSGVDGLSTSVNSNQTTLTIIQNGIIGSSKSSPNTSQAINKLFLGCRSQVYGSGFFNGYLYCLKVYTSVLSASQISFESKIMTTQYL